MYATLIAIAVLVALTWWFFFREDTPAPLPSITPVISTSSYASASSSSHKKKAKVDGPPCIVFYGSQTGTAEDFAHTLVAEATEAGFDASAVDMEDYSYESDLANEKFAIFVTATYGEGEPTDNAKDFYTWLADPERLQENLDLSNLNYTCFGLGNKTYENYNNIGRTVNKAMKALGAVCVYPHGEGDDNVNLEEDFVLWKKDMWEPIAKKFGLSGKISKGNSIMRRTLLEYPTSSSSTTPQFIHGVSGGVGPFDIKTPRWCQVLVNRELHSPTSDRSCRHLEIDIGPNITYEVGDHLGVFPENDPATVAALCNRLKLDPNQLFSMKAVEGKGRLIVGPCSFGNAFLQYFDLYSPPRMSMLQALVAYVKDPDEKKKFEKLCHPEQMEIYNRMILSQQRSILEILMMFPSLEPPIDHFLEIMPKQVPRYYSIASSCNLVPGHVHITSVVVSYTTPTGRLHNGVCSNWFLTRKEGSLAPCFVRKSQFRMPKSPSTPMIMVGPGTGLAPFRGFLQERAYLAKSRATEKLGHAVLYFGCRDRTMDFIYHDELLSSTQSGILTALHLAFSRERAQKEYVQHLLKKDENMLEVWRILSEGGHVYICGDAKHMAKDVHSALRDTVSFHGKLAADHAEQYLQNLIKAGRYQTDVWF